MPIRSWRALQLKRHCTEAFTLHGLVLQEAFLTDS